MIEIAGAAFLVGLVIGVWVTWMISRLDNVSTVLYLVAFFLLLYWAVALLAAGGG